ncbi:family 78 glycoside hydrolase catalytic domain, partial [Rhizobium leguminosarum]|uniref:family 78 glycoside hydrolase catalytic domain n=1 Tax=Rhizobium leguminosarum TaxID=384 RepID=UPI003F9A940E
EFDDKKWLKAELVKEPGGKLEAQVNANMKVMEEVKPLSIKQISPNKYILDLGQNLAGWIKMQVQGKRGDKVILRFAESL